MTPTAKSLILELLVAAAGEPLPARLVVDACALFDVSENSARVALVRLSSAGLIEASGRGAYRLAESAEGLAREVRSWRTVEERVRPFKGGYVVVHTGALGRADRTALKRRTRALSILGFAELERGLHVRPDNLEGGADGVRERLRALGLDHAAAVFVASSFGPEIESRLHSLWDGKALGASYDRLRLELERWLSSSRELEADVAARESFLLGGRAIRHIVYDPLLPPPFVDVEARRAFVRTMQLMDREGRRIWQRFFKLSDAHAIPRAGHAAEVH